MCITPPKTNDLIRSYKTLLFLSQSESTCNLHWCYNFVMVSHHWRVWWKNNVSNFVWKLCLKFCHGLWRDNRDNVKRVGNFIKSHLHHFCLVQKQCGFVGNAKFCNGLWRDYRDNLGRVENFIKSNLRCFCTTPFNFAVMLLESCTDSSFSQSELSNLFIVSY